MNSIATTTIHISAKILYKLHFGGLHSCATARVDPIPKITLLYPLRPIEREPSGKTIVCVTWCVVKKREAYIKWKKVFPLCSGYVHISHPPCSINQQHKRILKRKKKRNRREQRAEEKKLKLGEKIFSHSIDRIPLLGLGCRGNTKKEKKSEAKNKRRERELDTVHTCDSYWISKEASPLTHRLFFIFSLFSSLLFPFVQARRALKANFRAQVQNTRTSVHFLTIWEIKTCVLFIISTLRADMCVHWILCCPVRLLFFSCFMPHQWNENSSLSLGDMSKQEKKEKRKKGKNGGISTRLLIFCVVCIAAFVVHHVRCWICV